MWIDGDILTAIETGFQNEAAAIDLEQAVYGLDARDEVALHPLIAEAIDATGHWAAHREKRYPSDQHRHTKRSVGERCDMVLTPANQELAAPEQDINLFTQHDIDNACPLVDAYWLEVKVAHQFHEGRPRPSYGSALLTPAITDILKLAKDPVIRNAAVLLILFSENEPTAEHDLQLVERSLHDRNMPITNTHTATIPITERQGHHTCAMRLLSIKN